MSDVRQPARGLLNSLIGPCSVCEFRALDALVVLSLSVKEHHIHLEGLVFLGGFLEPGKKKFSCAACLESAEVAAYMVIFARGLWGLIKFQFGV